jgi:serine/threonine protein kinase
MQVSGNVHSDFKSENIMLVEDPATGHIDFKVIDLGSSFPFAKLNDYLVTTTPEYLPPEVLEYIEQKQSMNLGAPGTANDL